MAARLARNQAVAGSNPGPATEVSVLPGRYQSGPQCRGPSRTKLEGVAGKDAEPRDEPYESETGIKWEVRDPARNQEVGHSTLPSNELAASFSRRASGHRRQRLMLVALWMHGVPTCCESTLHFVPESVVVVGIGRLRPTRG